MISTWSKKAQKLLELMEQKGSDTSTNPAAGFTPIYFDQDFHVQIDTNNPRQFTIVGEDKLLFCLLQGLKQLSLNLSWYEWQKLKARDLENFLRDDNRCHAFANAEMDLKKIDFFLGLIFTEILIHLSLNLLEKMDHQKLDSYVGKHHFFNQWSLELNATLLGNNGVSGPPVLKIHQIIESEIIFKMAEDFTRDYSLLLFSKLEENLGKQSGQSKSLIKFVAIGL